MTSRPPSLRLDVCAVLDRTALRVDHFHLLLVIAFVMAVCHLIFFGKFSASETIVGLRYDSPWTA